MTYLTLLAAYMLGSIPFGLLLARLFGLGDLRAIGSGNIGATNVLRTGNKTIAAATLLLDMLKGSAAVWQTMYLVPGGEAYAAILAVFGHVWPVWLGFKGGKGVATTFGVLLVLMPQVALASLAIWIAVFAVTRISSLSALIALGIAPFIAATIEEAPMGTVATLLAVLIFHTHSANIRRLINGEEPRFGASA